VRAVLDPNILISALLSRSGSPARIVARWLDGEFELVVSDALLAELGRALAYAKLRERISETEAAEFIALLRQGALGLPDPHQPASRSADPGDDYLLALAESAQAVLVSGDRHLLALAGELPVDSAASFHERLDRRG
jgi:uncharacterized protein